MARCKGASRPDGEERHPAAVVQEVHKQYSETINKIMLTLLSVSFFCLLTIYGSPDKVLLKEDSTIKIPFTDTLMPFVGFSIVAPTLLIVLTVYLHIFFGYWLYWEWERQRINPHLGEKEPPIEGIPTLFSLPNLFSSVLTGFVFYGLVPLVLVSLTWKAAARSDMAFPQFSNVSLLPILMYVTGFVTCSLMFLVLWRCLAYPRLWQSPMHCVVLLLIIGLMVVVAYTRNSWFPRRLNLEYTELLRASLNGKDMRNAHAKNVNLKEALLEQACLERADLTSADLTDARLWNACLASAQLSRANLVNAHLPGANLTHADLTSANLTDADLTGADLTGACLTDATLKGTNLRDASLKGASLPANLRNTRLSGADLTGATLARTDACLTGTNRTSANLPADLPGATGCPRTDACLTGTNRTSANLPADFQNAHRIETDRRGATLVRADLTGADLTGTTLTDADLRGAYLTDATLTGAHLRGAYLTDADLTCTTLTDADLTNAYLTGTTLTDATLKGTNLRDAYLTGATLTGANLTDADLTNAYLEGADLTGADLTNARLTNAHLETVTGLTQAQVDRACGDGTTTLPAHLTNSTLKPCPPPVPNELY